MVRRGEYGRPRCGDKLANILENLEMKDKSFCRPSSSCLLSSPVLGVGVLSLIYWE